WPGRTLVVLADSPEREDRAKWAPHLSGPWEMVDVKGDHCSLLREPDAGETAAVVGRALREAQQMALPGAQQISLRETQQTTLLGAQQNG
ncbi:MAG TPA: hypothetical protein VLL08_20260, partial [Kineosporiaceae bacterium]|nr:hypothetical protein [Kineosporiaceae bacterium]